MPIKRICAVCGENCHGKKDRPVCRKCMLKEKRESSQFHSRYEYAKNWALQKKYGIDLGGFEALWIAFKGKCQICGINLTLPESGRGQKRSSCCIDHDHRTGNLRGLLCNSCNKAIGLLNDDKNIILNAYNYLGGSR